MTQAEIRAGIRTIIREQDTDAGTLFIADNVQLDFIINSAIELVVLDLIEDMPDIFLTTENISLVANTASYTLTTDWLRIMGIKRNVTGDYKKDIPYVKTINLFHGGTVGQTDSEPYVWTLQGNAVVFMPTPTAAYTNYAVAHLLRAEIATMASGGPAYIPRMAHRLIVLMSAVLIANLLEAASGAKWEKMYAYWLDRVRNSFGFRVQQQPRFVLGAVNQRQTMDARDPAFLDRDGFFD